MALARRKPAFFEHFQRWNRVRNIHAWADILAGERPQLIVPRHAWQSAQSLGDWTLVSCIVAPGFLYEGFEMAPPDWSPEGGSA